jgi:hypothetical protein
MKSFSLHLGPGLPEDFHPNHQLGSRPFSFLQSLKLPPLHLIRDENIRFTPEEG